MDTKIRVIIGNKAGLRKYFTIIGSDRMSLQGANDIMSDLMDLKTEGCQISRNETFGKKHEEVDTLEMAYNRFKKAEKMSTIKNLDLKVVNRFTVDLETIKKDLKDMKKTNDPKKADLISDLETVVKHCEG